MREPGEKSLTSVFRRCGRRHVALLAELPDQLEKRGKYLVTKDKQQPQHAGQPGGHSHDLVGTGIEREEIRTHQQSPTGEFSSSLGLGVMLQTQGSKSENCSFAASGLAQLLLTTSGGGM